MSVGHEPGTRPVLVGVDGSRSALDAVRWAAVEAARRGTDLLVTAVAPTGDRLVARPALGDQLRQELLTRGRRALDEAATAAEAVAPGLSVATDLLTGSPVAVLADQARRAKLLVLGSRGLGGLTGLVVGSVSVALSARSPCPVVVVRGADDAGRVSGPVVVGVDGTPNSDAAISFGYAAAASLGVPLIALHTWASVEFAPNHAPLLDWDAVTEETRVVLAGRLAGWSGKYPDVPVRCVVGRDGAATALVQLSADAQLVVVGSRGRGNLTGLVLGSVSHAVLHRSHCPVAIVRPNADADAAEER